MQGAYAVWMGQPVVLQVTTGHMRMPLRGTLVGESDNAVRLRIGETYEVDICKSMILAVEEDNWASMIT